MKKNSHLNNDIEYELLDDVQQDIELRDKMIVLYASPYSDILWIELHDHKKYYKLLYYEQSVLKHIILFKYSAKEPNTIFVINKNFKIFLKDLYHIVQILYYEFKKLQQIIAERLFVCNIEPLPKMIVEKDWNDIIIPLPSTIDEYMKTTLGKKTRKLIKIAIESFKNDFPDYKIQFFEKEKITIDQIEEIAILNQNRMKLHGIKSYLTDHVCQLHYQYASTSGFGFITICKIDEKTIGGFISTIIGEHAYGHSIAHDNSFSKYYAGQIVLVNTIKYMIEEKKIKYLHMLNGEQDYKYRYGGINHDFYGIRIFKDHNIHYFLELSKAFFRRNYKNYKQKLKTQRIYKKLRYNKMIHLFHVKIKSKLNKIFTDEEIR